MTTISTFLYIEIKDMGYTRLLNANNCKMNKAIHGLKSPQNCWNERFNTIMQEQAVVRIKNDFYLYRRFRIKDYYFCFFIVSE